MRYQRRIHREKLSPAKREMLAEHDQLQFKVRLITSGVVKALEYGLDEVHEFDICIEGLREARAMYDRLGALHHEVYKNPEPRVKAKARKAK